MTLTTHHLEFTATALTPVELDDQAGASIRGAIVGAPWERFCANKAARAALWHGIQRMHRFAHNERNTGNLGEGNSRTGDVAGNKSRCGCIAMCRAAAARHVR